MCSRFSRWRGAPAAAPDQVRSSLSPGHSLGELAGWREDRLFLLNGRQDLVLAAPDLADELAQEGLMIFLAERLVALREVVALLHLQPFERFDQLHRVLAATELALLHADLERVHSLVVRLCVAIGIRVAGVDLRQALLGFVEELVERRRIKRAGEDR